MEDSNLGERKEIIDNIEKERNSDLVVYFCGDRGIISANMAGDAIRPLYDHLLKLESREETVEKVDIYLYGRGGRLEVPWRIISMLREFYEEVNALIPYKAYSAFTLTTLGSDKTVMGKKGELSPVDPTLNVVVPQSGEGEPYPREIGVEDVSSYLTFLEERAGLSDQTALSDSFKILAEDLNPIVLGKIERAYSHIRLVARELLSLCSPPIPDREISEIVEHLTERIYLHGHGIGRKEAEEIGLRVSRPSSKVEGLIWNLYLCYEELMKLNTTNDKRAYFSEGEDEYKEEAVIATIESSTLTHHFIGDLIMTKIRELPDQLNISVNLQPQLPPSTQLNNIPNQIQQQIQQIVQSGADQVRRQVAEQVKNQSPVKNIDVNLEGGKWVEV